MNKFASQLLEHYKKNARPLPWRADATPYRVWLSEIMLQQTTVKTVIPYFEKFTQQFPTVEDLANASEEEVMHLWQGLGYYSRARNLHKCAKVIAFDKDGQFPTTEAELLTLPGVGPYTAAAIASMAFHQKATVMDGNVERVMARVFNLTLPLPTHKKAFKEKAIELTPNSENALYSNAIMELGATICTPRKPACETCPVQSECTTFQTNQNPEALPVKEPKKPKKVEHGAVYVIQDQNGDFYLQKRPEKGLLANLWEFPTTGWVGQSQTTPKEFEMIQSEAVMLGQIRHIFTHIDLTLDVFSYQGNIEAQEAQSFHADNLPPLPTLMKKVLQTAQNPA